MTTRDAQTIRWVDPHDDDAPAAVRALAAMSSDPEACGVRGDQLEQLASSLLREAGRWSMRAADDGLVASYVERLRCLGETLLDRAQASRGGDETHYCLGAAVGSGLLEAPCPVMEDDTP